MFWFGSESYLPSYSGSDSIQLRLDPWKQSETKEWCNTYRYIEGLQLDILRFCKEIYFRTQQRAVPLLSIKLHRLSIIMFKKFGSFSSETVQTRQKCSGLAAHVFYSSSFQRLLFWERESVYKIRYSCVSKNDVIRLIIYWLCTRG